MVQKNNSLHRVRTQRTLKCCRHIKYVSLIILLITLIGCGKTQVEQVRDQVHQEHYETYTALSSHNHCSYRGMQQLEIFTRDGTTWYAICYTPSPFNTYVLQVKDENS